MTATQILMAFRTIGGALVTVSQSGDDWHRWTCQGCGATAPAGQARTRVDANTHAGGCRAIDPTTIPTTI